MAESTARIERVVTHGSFWWDGQEFEVDNNVWLVGDDARVIVIDAAHSATEILAAIGGREVAAIICTHAHNDHVVAVPELRAATIAALNFPAKRSPMRFAKSSARSMLMSNTSTRSMEGRTVRTASSCVSA